jgi:phage shock protein C
VTFLRFYQRKVTFLRYGDSAGDLAGIPDPVPDRESGSGQGRSPMYPAAASANLYYVTTNLNYDDTDTSYRTTATSAIKTLRRSRSDRMVGGVCGGAAKFLGVDAALVRVLLVAATILGFGTGAVLYLICWLIVPEED